MVVIVLGLAHVVVIFVRFKRDHCFNFKFKNQLYCVYFLSVLLGSKLICLEIEGFSSFVY